MHVSGDAWAALYLIGALVFAGAALLAISRHREELLASAPAGARPIVVAAVATLIITVLALAWPAFAIMAFLNHHQRR